MSRQCKYGEIVHTHMCGGGGKDKDKESSRKSGVNPVLKCAREGQFSLVTRLSHLQFSLLAVCV